MDKREPTTDTPEAGPIRPLAGLSGAVPPAPAWFRAAVADAGEAREIACDGVPIETRTWGEPGRPGLLFIHGNSAHLGWWSFLAPFFARDHRVAVFSSGGMGRSGRRASYSIAQFAREAVAVAEATGLYDGGCAPVAIGHSMGGSVVLAVAADPTAISGGILVDTMLARPDIRIQHSGRGRSPPPATLADALARFRLSPPRPCANLFIIDHLARQAIGPGEDVAGWDWRVDPAMFGHVARNDPWLDLAATRVPLAFVRGSLSPLTGGDWTARVHAAAAPGTPIVAIPEAHHHVMADQPIALVAVLRALLATLPGVVPTD